LVQDRIAITGPDHLHTLDARSELARWRGESGDVHGAVDALTDLLEDCLRVLGPVWSCDLRFPMTHAGQGPSW
jgi:hypothetical protein